MLVRFLLALATAALFAAPAVATMPPARGAFPPELTEAVAQGLTRLPPSSPALGVSAAHSDWRVPVILVGFTDDPLSFTPAQLEFALFDSTGRTATGSVYDYYLWASRGRVRVSGRVVAAVQLPHDRAYYAYNSWGLNRISTPNNDAGMVRDAVLACDGAVNWSEFDLDRDGYVDMLWVTHAGIGGEGSRDHNDFWSITSGLSGYWNNMTAFETNDPVPGGGQRHMMIDRFSMLPERSWIVPGTLSEIGVYCHEFGHALGLPDLYDTRDGGVHNSGPGNWSLMSTGVYGGDGASPQYPVHPGAWASLYLGWTGFVRPPVDSLVDLTPIPAGGQVLDVSFQGDPSSEHFIAESRRRTGFDRTLPADGLLLYHVDEGVMGAGLGANTVNAGPTPGLQVVEADGRRDLVTGEDRGDVGDIYPGSAGRTEVDDGTVAPSMSTFTGAPTGLALHGISLLPAGARARVQVESPGWLAARDWTPASFTPLGAQDFEMIRLPGAGLATVEAAWLGDHTGVVLRQRAGDTWDAGIEVSGPLADASAPTIAALGTDGLAVVWVDRRGGSPALWYRGRVGGAWLPEQPLAPNSGEASAPRIAAEPLGDVMVAWRTRVGGLDRILSLRFSYLSPWGQPVPLSPAAPALDPPTIAVDRGGSIQVQWAEHTANGATLWFRRFAADTGLSHAMVLAASPDRSLSSPQVVFDSDNTAHVVWLEGRGGATGIHYQRRPAMGAPAPIDTLLEIAPGSVQDVHIAADPQGGLHVLDDLLREGALVARYRRRHPVRGWDGWPARITRGEAGISYARAISADDPEHVTTLLLGYTGGAARWLERRRMSDAPLATDVPRSAPATPAPEVRTLPNPLRAGTPLVLQAPAALAGTALEVFDVAGRRAALATLVAAGPVARARVDAAVTRRWAAGMYFVRGSARGPVTRLVVLH